MKSTPLPTLGLLTAALFVPTSLAQAPQNAAKTQATQSQVEKQIKELETRLNAAEQKAQRAEIEKDYIERVQKQYESYYEKVLSTQATLGTVVGAVFALAGVLSIKFFDERAKSQVKKGVEGLRTEFADKQKALEKLSEEATKKVATLETRSDYAFRVYAALNSTASKQHADAKQYFREAMQIYVENKDVFPEEIGPNILALLFGAIKEANPSDFENAAKNELTDDVYKKLEKELKLAAIELPELIPLIRKP